MFGVFLAAEACLLLTSVLVVVTYVSTDPARDPDDLLPPGFLLAAVVAPLALAAAVAVAGAALFGHGPRSTRIRDELAFYRRWRDVWIGLGIGVAALLLTIPAAALWANWVGFDEASSALGAAVGDRQFHPATAVALFLTVWLAAPLFEEVIFRGVLWRAGEHWRWNRWVIFAVTSVVFSVAHLELLRTPLLLALSIPLGLARMYTGNVLSAVIAHQVNNFLPAVALLAMTTGVLPG